MKRLTILKRDYSVRTSGGWFNDTSEFELLKDMTELKENKRLEELNVRKRKNKWYKAYSYDFKLKRDREQFLKDLPTTIKDFKYNSIVKSELKEQAFKIIEEM